jgi:hypothetical protein
MNNSLFYAPLTKIEKNDDGTLRVSGIASTETIDSDGEIISAAAMKAALPDFFKHGTGALREMHMPIAAGVVNEAEVVGGITRIVATVVDAEAIKKVRHGVFKGFSIGGRVKERDAKNRKIITKISLAEISLVDRPSNPDAILVIQKLADAKPDLAGTVENAWALLSPESRVHVSMMATHRLLGRPATGPR